MDEARKPKSEYWPIDKLSEWDKNPRTVHRQDLERLKTQIKNLGAYKPIIVNKQGVVVGGNMRLAALKELGAKEVWVSIVEAEDLDTMLQYALSDNDRVGSYNDTQLAELVAQSNISLADYKVDLGTPVTLDNMMGHFGPADREMDPAVHDKDMETFLHGSIKQIVTYFSNEQYMDVMTRIEKLRNIDPDNLKTNTDIFLSALKCLEDSYNE